MNSVTISGRLVRDPVIRYVGSEGKTPVANYTVAIDRPRGSRGQRRADFVDVVAWGPRARFAENWMGKGRKYEVTGVLQSDSYTRSDGVRVYKTQIRATRQEFADSRNQSAVEDAENRAFSTEAEHDFGDAELPF